jgi:hypothetical protein
MIFAGKFDKQNFELEQKKLQDRHDTTAAQVAETESLAKKLEGHLKQLKESMLNSDLKRRIAEVNYIFPSLSYHCGCSKRWYLIWMKIMKRK